MKFKTFVIALTLTAAPGLAIAGGCNFGKQQQAMSCAVGTTYDSATHSCVPVST